MEGLGEVVTALRGVLARVQGPTVGVGAGELMADVRGLQEVISAASAAQTVRIAQYAGRDEERTEEGVFVPVDRGVGHVNEFAGDDLAPVLGMAPSMATRRVHTAAALAAHLPLTLAAVAEGRLDPFRAQIVAEETVLADRGTCAAVEEVIFPRATGCTPGELRRLVRQALDRLDPGMVRARATRARAQRFVMRREGEIPGITEWWAHLPAEESAACWAAIEAAAAKAKAEDPSRGIDQCRADALVDLILGNAEVSTTLTIALPVDCLTPEDAPPPDHRPHHDTTDDRPHHDTIDGRDGRDTTDGRDGRDTTDGRDGDDGRDDGDGTGSNGGAPAGEATAPQPEPGDPQVSDPDDSADRTDPADLTDLAGSKTGGGADSQCLQAAAQHRWTTGTGAPGCAVPGIGIIPAVALQTLLGRFDIRVTRMLVDSATGVTLETGTTTYRPPARLQHYVHARDGTCRFPGCRVAARRCQLDHVRPWPHGPTAPGNLICLCPHHHRLKTHTRWRPHLHPDGTITWTDPYGQTYRTHPVDHLQTHVA